MTEFESLELDFLPVTSQTGEGTTKSGDAIVGRLVDGIGRQKVFVVDAGFQCTGKDVLAHLDTYYSTDVVDLAVSTHADGDHLNGFLTVLEEGTVRELMIHQPRLHAVSGISRFTNLEAVDDLLAAARRRGTTVSSPFTGEQRLDGHLTVLGPDKDFYELELADALDEAAPGTKALNLSTASRGLRNLLDGALGILPSVETLTDLGETSPRNETSVISVLTVGDFRVMLTGDAGRHALGNAANEYERTIGAFVDFPLWLFQAPHHGSRRNIGPSLLDRILGPRHAPWGQSAIISAAEGAPKHPSPKVTNALARRGCHVVATRGKTICYQQNMPGRPGWSPALALPALHEDGDDD